MKIRNTILSAVVGLATFTCMAATESQTQPEVGKPAPDFNLTTGDGSQVSLKDYHGKWVVLYFYPKDFTSGYGIGLTVAVPGFKPAPQLRTLPLPGFPPVVVGVAWSGKLSDIARQLLAELDVEAETQRARIGKGG